MVIDQLSSDGYRLSKSDGYRTDLVGCDAVTCLTKDNFTVRLQTCRVVVTNVATSATE